MIWVFCVCGRVSSLCVVSGTTGVSVPGKVNGDLSADSARGSDHEGDGCVGWHDG